MRNRVTLGFALTLVLMIAVVMGVMANVSRSRLRAEVQYAKAAQFREMAARDAAHFAELQALNANATAKPAEAAGPAATSSAEVEAIRLENAKLRARIRALESAGKINPDRPAQRLPDAGVP